MMARRLEELAGALDELRVVIDDENVGHVG
jgi:hypothetical protein